MNTFAFIFARGGSKGLPGKNILNLDGVPLIVYSILIAKKIKEISRIFVSTDDKDIARVAINYGAEVIERPAEFSRDNSPEWLAWRHAIDWLNKRNEVFDTFISLPATSPLRSVADIKKCLRKLDDETDVVVTVTETTRSPFFNMVAKNGKYVNLLIDADSKYTRRQDVPKAYDMTTVAYVLRPKFIMENDGIFQGRVKSIIIPNERAIDIDTELDFKIAELLIKNK